MLGYHMVLGASAMWENYGILLVDDGLAYRAIVPAVLRPLSVTVDCAANSVEAMQKVFARSYSLILMEIQLGADDGFTVAATIRQSAEWAQTCPIIAFTSVCPPEGASYFTERGFNDWIAKPFDGRQLTAGVYCWLGGGGDPPEVVAESRQLAALLGAEGAASMIDRLHGNLAEAVAEIDGGADAPPIGHRMGGLAGTLGFPTLSAAWLALQDDRAAWPTVRALTMEAIARRTASSDQI